MIVIIFLTGFTAAVAAVPPDSQRILGGSETTIDQYPSTAAVLFSFNLITYEQVCGGIILTTRSALTCAHCLEGYRVNQWRIRVGSTVGNSDGEVHNLSTFIIHHNYNRRTMDSDIAIMFTATTIAYNNNVQPASIAGSSYDVADNQVVWASGWGLTDSNQPSEHLRHVQMWSINQNTCQTLYATVSRSISNNMLCAGWLHVGGRAQCTGDSGGPLYHNGVVVGISSWSHNCGRPQFPSVNVRVSRFTSWILTNVANA